MEAGDREKAATQTTIDHLRLVMRLLCMLRGLFVQIRAVVSLTLGMSTNGATGYVYTLARSLSAACLCRSFGRPASRDAKDLYVRQ